MEPDSQLGCKVNREAGSGSEQLAVRLGEFVFAQTKSSLLVV